jgi:hypothetical protein
MIVAMSALTFVLGFGESFMVPTSRTAKGFGQLVKRIGSSVVGQRLPLMIAVIGNATSSKRRDWCRTHNYPKLSEVMGLVLLRNM